VDEEIRKVTDGSPAQSETRKTPAMNSRLKEGDVVCLKSGGFPMTILFRRGDEWVCQWFDSHGELQSSGFAETALKLVGKKEDADQEQRQIGFGMT
jgi:uncharacterized protein YodC (DUF2158 family)